MEHPEEPGRAAQRERFISLLKAEHRHSVLEVGAGLGLDGLQFVRAGIHYTGVDPSEGHVHLARAKGLDVSVASAEHLPFPDGAFPAVWAVSTLLYSTAADIDGVLRELVRVTAPNAPIAVGLVSDKGEEQFLILRAPPSPN
ncbi:MULTISPECIES: class I SAM-dependent methyltransferase [unclassified Arthrobacter]|uniref:class I SAM-dependent methyltransferase n=1 Tax=unclassified Arthrobacter TaxID=235627 RepID=UPI0033917D03